MPKKIQFAPSQVKWQLSTTGSVLVLVGLQNLGVVEGIQDTTLMANLVQIIQRAKSLNIPMIDLYGDDLMQGMQQLGEYVSTHPQLIIAGQISPMLKQILPHISSVTEQICVVDDAILLANQEQHIQWLDNNTANGMHHMTAYTLMRLWNLNAPSEYILSPKGILMAVAEALEMDALEIEPTISLKDCGLDSVAVVSLVGLWRAHGANIQYEDVFAQGTLHALMNFMLQSAP